MWDTAVNSAAGLKACTTFLRRNVLCDSNRPHAIAVVLLVAGALASACSSSKPVPAPAAAAPPQALWGDMKPIVSVKELMQYMIDPASDYIFDSVSTVIKPDGTGRRKSAEDRCGLGEAPRRRGDAGRGNLSAEGPRPFTPPGDENNSVGPDATELSPAQILAKVQKDPVEWNARIEALRNVGLEVLEIVKRKNTSELWDASENLDVACEQCHASYWYPKEDAEFYRVLNKRLADFSRSSSGGAGRKPPAGSSRGAGR